MRSLVNLRAVEAACHDLVMRLLPVGSDGLRRQERHALAERYAATVGRPPSRSPERTELMRVLAAKTPPRRGTDTLLAGR